MAGVMLINNRNKRLAELSGKLISEVKFGGGILGHLDKGGTFEVKQGDGGARALGYDAAGHRIDGEGTFL